MTAAWKYLAFARIAAREANRERGELLGRAAFFGVILGVFSALWSSAIDAGTGFDADTRRQMVWYLAVTEWIVLSTPLLHVGIQDDVRRGDIVYQLGRPVSYVGAMLARGVGQLVVRLTWLGVAAVGWAWLFSGHLPDVQSAVWLVPLGLLAATSLCLLYLLVGLAAFWIHEVNSLYWMTQKLTFILGGLMLPLSLYPVWLRDLARATPFANILEGPASMLLAAAPWSAGELSLRLLAWSALFMAVAVAVLRRAAATLQPSGG